MENTKSIQTKKLKSMSLEALRTSGLLYQFDNAVVRGHVGEPSRLEKFKNFIKDRLWDFLGEFLQMPHLHTADFLVAIHDQCMNHSEDIYDRLFRSLRKSLWQFYRLQPIDNKKLPDQFLFVRTCIDFFDENRSAILEDAKYLDNLWTNSFRDTMTLSDFYERLAKILPLAHFFRPTLTKKDVEDLVDFIHLSPEKDKYIDEPQYLLRNQTIVSTMCEIKKFEWDNLKEYIKRRRTPLLFKNIHPSVRRLTPICIFFVFKVGLRNLSQIPTNVLEDEKFISRVVDNHSVCPSKIYTKDTPKWTISKYLIPNVKTAVLYFENSPADFPLEKFSKEFIFDFIKEIYPTLKIFSLRFDRFVAQIWDPLPGQYKNELRAQKWIGSKFFDIAPRDFVETLKQLDSNEIRAIAYSIVDEEVDVEHAKQILINNYTVTMRVPGFMCDFVEILPPEKFILMFNSVCEKYGRCPFSRDELDRIFKNWNSVSIIPYDFILTVFEFILEGPFPLSAKSKCPVMVYLQQHYESTNYTDDLFNLFVSHREAALKPHYESIKYFQTLLDYFGRERLLKLDQPPVLLSFFLNNF